MWWLEVTMVYSVRQYVLPVFGLLLIIKCIISLQLLELLVPAHVPLGTRAQLSCRWQLGPADVLYSVKWYKDGREFFRHVPRDSEPRRKFPLPGVDVEDSDESGSNLTLGTAVLETEGRYRCEVSGEGPLFPTVSDHADMAVVVLPDHGPMITGFHPRYRPGDRAQVTCTSGRSRPATALSWYINGEPVASANVLPMIYEKYEGLEVTRLVLDFILTEEYFKDNGVKIKCLATIAPIYWRSNEESAVKEKTLYDKFVRSPHERASNADRVLSNFAGLTCRPWKSAIVMLMLCSKI